jgi:phosphoglycolate phosphatase
MMQKPFELIVFDWDGTLMDSEAHIVASMERSIEDLTLPSLEKVVIRNVIGLGLREAILTLYPDADEETCRQLTDRYRYHFLADDPCEAFAGAQEVLHSLNDQGYWLAVATGKGRRGLDRVLESTGFRGYFHVTRCADETRSKPHPQMLEEIMAELGVAPSATLMVGDTEYDLQMAQNAGTASMAVSYGVHDVERLMDCQPLACLDAIHELTDWLAKAAEGPVLKPASEKVDLAG